MALAKARVAFTLQSLARAKRRTDSAFFINLEGVGIAVRA
jgi:hypothetical protein